MKKKILLIAMLFMVTLLTGCGSKEKVVIYTSMEEERNQKLSEMVKKEFPELNVVIQHMATGNSAAKIKNEGTNVEADIVIDLETAHMKDIQKNFADLSKFDSSFYMDGVNTSSNYLTWVKYTMNLIIDNKYFKEHNLSVPKTYEKRTIRTGDGAPQTGTKATHPSFPPDLSWRYAPCIYYCVCKYIFAQKEHPQGSGFSL